MKNKIVTVSGASWAGKWAIVDWVMKDAVFGILRRKISTTTRNPRANNNGVMEQDGREYHFRTEDYVRQLLANNLVIEYEEPYPGKIYATTVDSLEKIRDAWHIPICDIDVKGAMSILERYPYALQLFIDPSLDREWYARRITERWTMSEADLKERLDRIDEELLRGHRFQHVIQNPNGQLDAAIHRAKHSIHDYLYFSNTIWV
jgi:guanylate kinase